MISLSFSCKGLLALACIITVNCSDNQTTYELSDSEDFSNQVLNLIKDELQLVNMELTKSFIADHERKKRSLHDQELIFAVENGGHDMNLGHSGSGNDVMDGYPLINMNGETFVMTENGTFRVGLLHEPNSDGNYKPPDNHAFPGHSNPIVVVQVSNWHPPRGEIILSNIYWRQTHFFLATTKDRTFSLVYTSTGTGTNFGRPILRQQIKNHGLATAAKFFVHKVNLYLLIANDNPLHSLTLCPLFRWEGTYMDEIHNIQTRGTTDIVVFVIDYITFLVLAQSGDTAGNSEIGTQVIKMNDYEELEKVQLLWSNGPVALAYFPGFKEHFLIIGQRRESSICYWFGGFDFIHWQRLDDIFGDHIYFDVLSIKETSTILLAATETMVKFYTATVLGGRTPTIAALDTTFNVAPHQRILGAKFLRLPDESYCLSVQVAENNRIHLLIRKLEINFRQIAASQIREEDSKLSNCLETVKTLLDATEDMIAPINALSSLVLTKDGAWNYHGALVSESNIILHTKSTVTNTTRIKPHVSALDAALLPHRILEATHDVSSLFHENNKKLKSIVRKSYPNDITGDIQFSKLDIENFKSHGSSLLVEYLNDIESLIIRHDVLRKEVHSPQMVKGVWWMKDLSAKTFVTSHWNKEIEANTKRFLQLNSHDGHVEIVRSELQFVSNMTFGQDLSIPEQSSINGVSFSELAFRNFEHCHVKGFKKSDSVHGIAKFRPEYVNGVLFQQWMDETIKLSSGSNYQNVTGTKVFEGSFFAENLDLETINNLDWKPFTQSVLFKNSNKTQTIEGNIKCMNLDVEDAAVTKLNDINISNLLRNSEYQKISSQVKVRHLHITNKNQAVEVINGYPFSTFAILNQTMRIRGPLVLENVQVGNVYTKEDITIGKKSVSSMAKLRKKLIIATKAESFNILKDITAHSLFVDSINNVPLKDIPHNYWSSRKYNAVNVSLDLSSRQVNVVHKFDTGELNQLKIPQDFVDSKRDTAITSPISFLKPIVVNKKVMMADNARLNNYDKLPILEQNIVRLGKKNKILDHKFFNDHCYAANGLNVTTVNGLDFHNDIILLDNHHNYHFTGKKSFPDIVAADLHTLSDIKVSNTVNRHYNLKHILNNTVTQSHNGRPIHVSSDVVFNDTINASEISANEINGMRFKEDIKNVVFLNKQLNFREIVIHGTTVFEKDADVKLLNDVPIEEYLAKVSRKNLQQFVGSHKEFKNVECDDLVCPKINSIDLLKLKTLGLSKTRSQNITSPYTFSQIKSTGYLRAHHFSGIPVVHFAQNGHPMFINPDVEILGGRNGKLALEIPLKNYIKGHINGYDIRKLASQITTFPDYREFGSIHVLGNINWKNDSRSMSSLSYLRGHALKKETPQEVMRKTYFKKHVSIKNLKSNEWIGGVNLKYIEDDSTWENSEMVFAGSKDVFHKIIVDKGLKTNSTRVEMVNSHNFSNFVEHLLLEDSSFPHQHQSISGTKLFMGPVDFGNIHTSGNNVFNSMIPVNSSRKPHFAHFHDAEVFNLQPDKEFMSQVLYLLENRVNLEGAQSVTGNYSFNNLNAVHCDISRLNDIRSTDLLYTNYSKPQYIVEENTVEHLIVKGDVIASRINNHNLKYLYDNSYHTNETISFSQPVIFKNKVSVTHSLHIQNHSNFDNAPRIIEKYTHNLQRSIQDFPASDTVIQSVEYQISSLAKNSSSPVWLEYLRLQHEWTTSKFKLRIEQVTDEWKTILSFYDQRENNDVGLPKGCYCRSVEFLYFENEKFPDKFQRMDCGNAFLLQGQESIYAFYGRALSYNATCSKPNEKKSLLVKFNRDVPKAFTLEATISEYAVPIADLEVGYVADAKIFSSKGVDYIILAQYYNSITGKHSTSSIVYTVSQGKILKTQLINSHGARRLAISTVDSYQILAIANSYHPDSSSCESHSSILIWSEKEGQFLLLREVKTNLAIDVVFLSIETRTKENQLEFVAFAQNVNTISSSVDIYQYDLQFKTFLIYQTINFEWEIESLHTVSISDVHYLIITAQSGLMFYEYSFVEGFRQRFTVPITGATDVTSFIWRSRLFFGITSKNMSILAEGLLSSPFVANL